MSASLASTTARSQSSPFLSSSLRVSSLLPHLLMRVPDAREARMKQSRPMLSDELRRLGRWPAYQCRIRTVPGLWRLYMLDVTAYSGRVLGVFVIVLVALG